MASALIDDVIVARLVITRVQAAGSASVRVYAPEEPFDADVASQAYIRLSTMRLESDPRGGGSESTGADADFAAMTIAGSAVTPAAVTDASGGYAISAVMSALRTALRGKVERDATTGHIVEFEAFSVDYLEAERVEVEGQGPTMVRMAMWECRGRVTRASGTTMESV